MAPLFLAMNEPTVKATSVVTETDRAAAPRGMRFARLDLLSQFALLAVEKLGAPFESFPPGRIGVCLAARAGSLSTDLEYWKGREIVGGLSPTLFAYTLPSAAIGEIAIRYRLTGPNLCFVGDSGMLLAEARDMVHRGEADGCVGVYCDVISVAAAELIQAAPAAEARAFFLAR